MTYDTADKVAKDAILKSPEAKFIAASTILVRLPAGRGIDDQTLMLEAAQLSGQDFDAQDADELYRRINGLSGSLHIVPVDTQSDSGGLMNIHYFIWKAR